MFDSMALLEIMFFLGRLIYGLMLILMGINHFINYQTLVDYARGQGLILAPVAVIASAIVLILGASSILLGIYTQYGVLLLVLFFLPVTFTMHRFWAISDPTAQMLEMNNFMKNFIIMGAALMFLALDAWPYAISAAG